MNTKTLFLLVLLVFSDSLCQGVIFHFQSLEWLVDKSQVVVLATGAKNPKEFIEKIVPLKTFKGTFDKRAILPDSAFAFGYGYHDWTEKDQFLLFFQEDEKHRLHLNESTNLDRMNFPFHCLPSKNMFILKSKNEIFSIIETRAKRNPKQIPTPENGRSTKNLGYLILPISAFKNASISEATQYLFVPADPEYKDRIFSEAMKSPRSAFWIRQLVNFPEKKVKMFLFKCLEDRSPWYYYVGMERKRMKYFPIQQAAYSVLVQMGEKVERPESYDEAAENFYRY